MPDEVPEKAPDLSISPEKVCYIIAKAREFDAKDVVTDPDDASNPNPLSPRRTKDGALLSTPAPSWRFAFEPAHADERGR
ncbi:MAG: hypothetical protein WAK55_30625 [Xanthobacteraceae bacterium]